MPNSDPFAAQLVRSDSTGNYLAYDIPVGGVSVFAAGPEGQTNATGFGSGWIDGPGKTAIVDITLQNTGGSVAGKVIDSSGKPVARMLVIAGTQIPGIKDPVVVGFCYTSTDGVFQLTKLPLAVIRVYATEYMSRQQVVSRSS